jgi:hypothetical protein
MNLASDNLLAVAIGAVVVDTIFLLMNYSNTVFVSKELTRWYVEIGPAAMAMDIIIITLVTMIGIHIARKMNAKVSLSKTAGVVVALQILHDVLFYIGFSYAPKGLYVFDVFKAYADEVGYHAIWSDSLMVLGTLGVAEAISNVSLESQTMWLLASIYTGLFALYTKTPVK